MKKSILLFLGFFLFSVVYPQEWTFKLEEKRKQNHELTFFDYQEAFYTWCAENDVNEGYMENNGIKEKVPGWKQFKRWEWYWESRIDAKTGEFPKTTAYLELRKNQEQYPNQNKSLGNWTSLGPFETNEVDGNGDGLGRVNCVAFHPNPNIIYIGSPSGGLWKTTDGGNLWNVLTDGNEVLGVSAILVIPGQPYDIIYIGTGDRDSGDNHGIGVLKSMDGGNTWQNTGLSFESNITNSLVLDPVNQNIIYAGTENGIYKTSDAGTNWTQLFTIAGSFGGFKNIVMHPTNNQILYATISSYTDWFHSYIYKTTDAGQTWTVIQDVYNGKRTEIAVSPAQPNWLYAVVSNPSGGLQAVYKSTNAGNNFTEVFNGSTKNLLGSNCNGTSSGGQGYFDLALAVDPSDANILYVGGINTWKSISSGYTWSIFNQWYNSCSGVPVTHADKHYLGFQPNTSILFEGNDGGLYKAINGGSSFESLSNGLIISQMYRLGVSQTEPNATICGFQDNGTKLLQSDNTWAKTWSGDGMECIIDFTDYNIKYFTTQNGYIHRRIGLYGADQIWANGLPVPGPWVTAYIMDPNDHLTLYAGYNEVYKTTNQGNSWTSISNFGIGGINALAIAPSNSNYLYTAKKYTDGFFRTTDGGNNWTNILNNLPGVWDFAVITYISVKNDDPGTLWISVGGYDQDGVFQSSDAGNSWVNISNGLPEIPVNCVIQNKQSIDVVELYAATDVGVYVKYGDNDWFPFYDEMPNVIVTELEIIYDNVNPSNSKLRASTYGRGLWESDLFNSEPPFITLQPTNIQGCQNESLFLEVGATNATEFQWFFNGNAIVGGTEPILHFNPAIPAASGNYYCKISNLAQSINSNTAIVSIGEIPSPEITGNLDICGDETTILDAGFGYSSYHWSTNETTQTIEVSSLGNYSVLVSTPLNCEGSDNVYVNVTDTPFTPVIVNLGQASFCETESTLLSVNNPETGVVYHWSNGQTGSIIEISSSGDYTCFGKRDDCSGEISNMISVQVFDTPLTPVIVTTAYNLCVGENAVLTVQSPQPGIIYHWSNGATGNSISVVESGVYSVTGDNGNCQSFISNLIELTFSIMPAAPTISAEGATTFCIGESVVLNVNNPETGVTYHWSNNVTGNSITVTTAGTYSCYGQSSSTCTGGTSNSIPVVVNPLVTVTQQPASVTVLAGQPFTLTCAGSNIVSYQWYHETTLINGATSASYSVASATSGDAGTYYCQLTNGCGSVNTNTVTVYVTPLMLTINPTSVTVSANSSNTSFAITSNESWSIVTSDNLVIATPNSGSGNSSIIVSYPSIATMAGETYTATVTSGSGIVKVFTITQNGVNAFVTLTPDQASVPESTGSLTFSVSCPPDLVWNLAGLDPWLSATPLTGTGQELVTLNYQSNTNTSSRSDDFTVSGSGATDVFLINQAGAVPPLQAVATSDKSEYSLGQTIYLFGTATGGSGSYIYSWTGTGGFISNLQNPYITPITEGIYTYVLTVNDGSASADDELGVGVWNVTVSLWSDMQVAEIGQTINFISTIIQNSNDSRTVSEIAVDMGDGNQINGETNPFVFSYSYEFIDSYDIAVNALLSDQSIVQETFSNFIDIIVGIGEPIQNKLTIYPNPTDGIIWVNGESVESLKIFDITGKVMMYQDNIQSLNKIDLSNFPTGLFFIYLSGKAAMPKAYKLIKR